MPYLEREKNVHYFKNNTQLYIEKVLTFAVRFKHKYNMISTYTNMFPLYSVSLPSYKISRRHN